MNSNCDAAVTDDELLDYWIGADNGNDAGAGEGIEEHLFRCADCAARLEAIMSLGAGLATLVQRGRVSGIVSRALLNRIQRAGINVRTYSLWPGERVACAAFPEDDLMVVSLRGDFRGAEAVSLAVTAADGSLIGQVLDVPLSGANPEILWATPGAVIRQMPSSRVRLVVSALEPESAVVGEYELDHTHIEG